MSAEFSAEIQAVTVGKKQPAAAPYELPSQLCVACSTYNAHSSSISCDLTPWIECHFTGQGPAPDIVVIGMQEITMTPRSLISEETQEGCDWGALLLREINSCSMQAGLHDGAPSAYVCLVSRQLVGMALYVFVSHALHTVVVSAASASLPLGALSMFGNKGAIEVRLLIGSFSMQFINCHLMPHPPNLAKRNQQVRCPPSAITAVIASVSISLFPQVQAIFAHFPAADFSLFLGDMNYRVDLDSGHVRKLAAAGAHADIVAHCQMHKVMQQEDSPFAGFLEAPITFAPSYSYDVGTDNFDSSPKYGALPQRLFVTFRRYRIPSYCDRILWRASSSRSSSAIACTCSLYHMSPLSASDHKPVVAVLQLSMTHPPAHSRASIATSPIAPMNIGMHSRMNFVSSGPLPASTSQAETSDTFCIRL